ncbi:hypothetical protein TNCT_93601 [Trichonephila clavata]|uniref:Uncharacterized protein n=1 Tax=Trichonephila clavata TaxID=2740835 RepID=A0A8X6GES6_TRICU|nr:hypothetical protein TNCT_93601 [Trichonephila clavata]
MGLWRNRTGASKFTCVCENDPDASGNMSSNYENNEVNTCPLNSSELNAATERKLSLLSSHTSAEHVISEQNDPTYVLVDTNVWKNLLSTVKCPECDMNNLNIIKTTQLGMASKLELSGVECCFSFSRRRGLGHEDNTENLNLNGVFLEREKKSKTKKKRVVKPPKFFIHDSPVDCIGDTGVFLHPLPAAVFRVFDAYVKIVVFDGLVGFGNGTGIQDFGKSVELTFLHF